MGFAGHYIVWDVDPVLVHVGPLVIRYYGLLFVAVFVVGYLFWRWQMLRYGADEEAVDKFLLWTVVAVIVGARLGHCFFYEPGYYLAHPEKIVMIWKGGLSSHGATIGLVFALWLFHRVYRYPFVEVIDRFAFSATTGATLVRVGNLLNSEIVGRTTDVPWAFRFVRYEDHGLYPRHPSQIYEILLGLLVFAVLFIADGMLGEKRPRWLMTGLFFATYFTGRFIVEFWKEYVSIDPSASPLTMGQYLSILPALFGYFCLFLAYRNHQRGVAQTKGENP